jgi:hypothetical protein
VAASSHQVEPNPVSIVETGDGWQVFFRIRAKHQIRNGREVVVKQFPECIRVDVRKADLTASIVPTR